MSGSIRDAVTMSNGVSIPLLGVGTFKVPEGRSVEDEVKVALEIGYRHIDTAAVYGNERGVGQAVRASGIPRDEIFVTTKVWNDALRRGPDAVLKAIDESLDRLGMEHVDLYLIHWPVPGRFVEAWSAMEQIYAERKARAIGVSNFLLHHLKELLPKARVKPMADQIEFHPRLMQRPLMDFCREHQIVQEAWAPLMQGKIFSIPKLQEIASKYGKTVAQVALKWEISHGVVTIPKSVHRDRLAENADLYDFDLSPEDIKQIDALDRNERIGADPDNFNF